MPNSLSEELRNILRQDLAINADTISRDDRLIADLGMDSVAFAIALVAVEDHTGVQLSGEQLQQCRTVGEVDDLLRAALAGGSPSPAGA